MKSENSKKSLKYAITPEEVVNWVKSNFEIRDINKKGWIKICNPFQERETGVKDTKFHFNVHPKNRIVKDWRPNHASHDGNFLQFVCDYLRCEISEAISAVKSARKYDLDLNYDDFDDAEPDKPIIQLELPSPCWNLDEGPEKMRNVVISYLESRCVSLEEAKFWKIMYGIGTVIFPYVEYDEIVYWQSREIADKKFLFPDEKKYGVSKTQFFWGWHRAEPGEDLYIAESLFGVPSIGVNALASGGGYLEEKQALKLDVLSPNRIILCPDNDDAGVASLIANYKILSDYKDKLYYCVPPRILDHNNKQIKDWNELDQFCTFHTDLAAERLGKEAKLGHSYVRWYIKNNFKKLDLKATIKLRKQLTKVIDPLIRQIVNNK